MLRTTLACAFAAMLATVPALAQEPSYAQKVFAEVQQALAANDYDPGRTDGVIDTNTVAALQRFQQDHGLPPTGIIDARTLAALGVTARESVLPSTEFGTSASPPTSR